MKREKQEVVLLLVLLHHQIQNWGKKNLPFTQSFMEQGSIICLVVGNNDLAGSLSPPGGGGCISAIKPLG